MPLIVVVGIEPCGIMIVGRVVFDLELHPKCAWEIYTRFTTWSLKMCNVGWVIKAEF